MITFITPCSRPAYLPTIRANITSQFEDFTWIIVYDSDTVPNTFEDERILQYAITSKVSVSGNAQRNFGLDIVRDQFTDSYVYFLDDDNILHPSFRSVYDNITHEVTAFSSEKRDGSRFMTVESKNAFQSQSIDTANVILSARIAIRYNWILSLYGADGYYFANFRDNPSIAFVPGVHAYYNYLR